MMTIEDLTRLLLQAPTTVPTTPSHVWVNNLRVCMTLPASSSGIFTLDQSVLDGPDVLA